MGCSRGCLTAIVGFLVALALLLDGADVVARHLATSKITSRIKTQEPTAEGVSVHIHSFPFLKIVANGHVDEVGARIARITVGPLAFSDVDVEVHTLKIRTHSLLFNGKVEVTNIHTGTVTATVTATALSKAVGVPVSVTANGFVAQGIAIAISVNGAARKLTVAGGIPAVTFALPGPAILPCVPAVAFANQAVTLSCTFSQVPSAFTSVAT